MYRSRFIDEVQVGKHGAGPHQLLIHLQHKLLGIYLRLLQMGIVLHQNIYFACSLRGLTSLLRNCDTTTMEGLAHRSSPRQARLAIEGGHETGFLHLDVSTLQGLELHLDVFEQRDFAAPERVYNTGA